MNRNHSLDTLRAVAIALVVNCHIGTLYRELVPNSAFARWLGLGGHGVDLFFVMSGWLLGSIIFKEINTTNNFNAIRFIIRRWLRTLPVYYTVLGATLFQMYLSNAFNTGQASYIFFLQSYYLEDLPIIFVSWSLCVEEHFYLLIAIIFWLFASKHKHLFFSLLLCLAAPSLFRLASIYGVDYQTHVRVDQCAAGVLLAYFQIYHSKIWNIFQKTIPALLVASVAIIVTFSANRILELDLEEPLSAFTLIAVTLVGLSERSAWYRNLKLPLAQYVASRSYSMYFMHVEAIAVAKKLGFENFVVITLITWCLGLGLSEILYRTVELPIMNLRKSPWVEQIYQSREKKLYKENQ